MACFVDTDHAGHKTRRWSYIGMILLLNNTPVNWLCRRQSTIDALAFDSECLLLRDTTGVIIDMRYKLHAMGVPIGDPSSVLCGNSSLVTSSKWPKNRFKKNLNTSAFHKVRESIAAKITQVVHVWDLSNLCTISLPSTKCKTLLSWLMFINTMHE